MGNVEVAFIFLGLGLIVVLIGPSVTEEWAERRLARKRKEKLERKAPRSGGGSASMGGATSCPTWSSLRRTCKRSARTGRGRDIALLNRNRDALAEIVKALDERDIPHPLLPPHGDTEEWETFLWNFIRRVRAGEAEKLPTLYDDLRKAVERAPASQTPITFSGATLRNRRTPRKPPPRTPRASQTRLPPVHHMHNHQNTLTFRSAHSAPSSQSRTGEGSRHPVRPAPSPG